MIKTIRLQRFKKFEDVEVQLRPFTVLMGENSSGKTTVLQAANLALSLLGRNNLIQDKPGAGVQVRGKGVGLTALPGINIADFREVYYGKISRGGKARGAGGAILELKDLNENLYRLQMTSLFGTFNVKCTSAPEELANNPDLHRKSPLFISGFVGLRAAEERLFPLAIRHRLQYGQVSEIIRNLLLDTKKAEPEAYEKLQKRLEKDFSFYLDDIEFDEQSDRHVTGHYKDTCGGKSVSLDFNSSGSGFMQILQILTPIYRFAPKEAAIVLLDEPDAHLHTNLQSALAGTLREIQEELKIQIIVSTHSTAIIRATDPSDVVPVSAKHPKNTPLTSIEDVENQIRQRLAAINTYDLAKSVLSGKIVFAEDANLQILQGLDKTLGTKCFSGANTVPIVSGIGKDEKIPFRLHEILKEVTGREIEIHLIRDGDAMPDDWRVRLAEFSKERKVVLHHLALHEVESYLLIPEIIHRALEQKHAGQQIPPVAEIRELIAQTLKATISLNKFGFEDLLEDSIYKTALCLGIDEYRNPQKVKSEAKAIREKYEAMGSFDEVVRVGMGKEALTALFGWLNGAHHLNLNRNDILNVIASNEIAPEIRTMLETLKSQEVAAPPVQAQVEDVEDEDDDEWPELDLFAST